MNTVLVTQLTPEECHRRLGDAVLSGSWIFGNSSGGERIIGQVKVGQFRLRVRRWFFAKYQQELFGRVEATPNGSQIILRSGRGLGDWLSLIVTCGILGGLGFLSYSRGAASGEVSHLFFLGIFTPKAVATVMSIILFVFVMGWFASRDDPKGLEAFVRQTLDASPALRS